MALVFDPLFRVPWLVGLLLALLLPVLGVYLRLRDEWLAALGIAQVSAATGLAGLALGLPGLLGGCLGGALMVAVKTRFATGNNAYAVMILAGWSATFLIAGNSHLGDSLGQAMMDGQLYLVQSVHAWAAMAVSLSAALLLWRVSSALLRSRLFPHDECLPGHSLRAVHLSFDLVVALSLAVATAALGIMATFAMVFMPAWLAFRYAASWRQTLVWALGFNLVAFLLGFVFAMLGDQPYGPVQVAVHLVLAAALVVVSKLSGALHHSG